MLLRAREFNHCHLSSGDTDDKQPSCLASATRSAVMCFNPDTFFWEDSNMTGSQNNTGNKSYLKDHNDLFEKNKKK